MDSTFCTLDSVHPFTRFGAARRLKGVGWGESSGFPTRDRRKIQRSDSHVRELRFKTAAEDAGLAGYADSRAQPIGRKTWIFASETRAHH